MEGKLSPPVSRKRTRKLFETAADDESEAEKDYEKRPRQSRLWKSDALERTRLPIVLATGETAVLPEQFPQSDLKGKHRMHKATSDDSSGNSTAAAELNEDDEAAAVSSNAAFLVSSNPQNLTSMETAKISKKQTRRLKKAETEQQRKQVKQLRNQEMLKAAGGSKKLMLQMQEVKKILNGCMNSRHKKIEAIALCCEAILCSPESELFKLEVLFALATEKKESGIEYLCSLERNERNSLISTVALVSIGSVLKNIIPAYSVLKDFGIKDSKKKLSKIVERTWNYEKLLLSYFKQFVSFLKSRPVIMIDVTCPVVCDLLYTSINFNDSDELLDLCIQYACLSNEDQDNGNNENSNENRFSNENSDENRSTNENSSDNRSSSLNDDSESSSSLSAAAAATVTLTVAEVEAAATEKASICLFNLIRKDSTLDTAVRIVQFVSKMAKNAVSKAKSTLLKSVKRRIVNNNNNNDGDSTKNSQQPNINNNKAEDSNSNKNNSDSNKPDNKFMNSRKGTRGGADNKQMITKGKSSVVSGRLLSILSKIDFVDKEALVKRESELRGIKEGAKIDSEIARDLRSSSVYGDINRFKKNQTEIIRELFVSFLRIFRSPHKFSSSALTGSLEGLGNLTYLVNVELASELFNELRELITEDRFSLSPEQLLSAIKSAINLANVFSTVLNMDINWLVDEFCVCLSLCLPLINSDSSTSSSTSSSSSLLSSIVYLPPKLSKKPQLYSNTTANNTAAAAAVVAGGDDEDEDNASRSKQGNIKGNSRGASVKAGFQQQDQQQQKQKRHQQKQKQEIEKLTSLSSPSLLPSPPPSTSIPQPQPHRGHHRQQQQQQPCEAVDKLTETVELLLKCPSFSSVTFGCSSACNSQGLVKLVEALFNMSCHLNDSRSRTRILLLITKIVKDNEFLHSTFGFDGSILYSTGEEKSLYWSLQLMNSTVGNSVSESSVLQKQLQDLTVD